jgi:N-acetylmuramoyl-L-alanine amidase CwlA
MEAQSGGKHYGSYKTLSSQTDAQLLKSARSHAQNIKTHNDKVNNPSKYIDDWETMSKEHKNGMIAKWNKDIERISEQLEIANAIARERGILG